MDLKNNKFLQFKIFMVGHLISRFGDSLDMIAFMWLSYKISGSMLVTSFILAINGLPSVIFGLFAGVLVDRYNKRKIMKFCDMGRCLIVLSIGILNLFGILKIWYLLLATFLNSTLEVFSDPARNSIPPLLIEKERLLQINSWVRMFKMISELIGLGISGLIIKFLGISTALIIDAITFLISFFTVSVINIDHIPRSEKLNVSNFIRELKEGFYYIVNERVIFYTSIMAIMVNFFIGPFNILSANFSKDILKYNEVGHGILNMMIPIGIICGSYLVPKVNKLLDMENLIKLGYLLIGIGFLSISFSKNIIVSSACVMLIGIGCSFVSIPSVTILHRNTRKEIMGRVLAIISTFTLATIPLGNLSMGFFLQILSIDKIFLYAGLFLLLITLSGIIKSRNTNNA